MITLYKYWFRFEVASPEVLEKARHLEATYGYISKRKNCYGETMVSEMFVMHCQAATVKIYWLLTS